MSVSDPTPEVNSDDIPLAPQRFAALGYARRGWAVLPIKPNAKAPLTANGFKDASADPKQIDAWWARWPTANIGIATGPSGLVVFDVDKHADHDGADAWHEWRTMHELSDETPNVITPSGGVHYYYRRNGHAVASAQGRPAVAIDIRGETGYVVAPPSKTEAGEYVWETPPEETDLFDLPDSIASLLAAAQHEPAAPLPDGDIAEGKRHAALVSLAGSMRWRNATESAILAALEAENARCSPPLPEDEVRRIAESIAKKPAGTPDRHGVEDTADQQVVPARVDTATWPHPAPAREWLFQDTVPLNTLVQLDAAGASGKSWLALMLAATLTTGRPMLPHFAPARIGPVLFLQGEDHPDEMARRFSALREQFGFSEGDVSSVHQRLHLYCQALPLFTAAGPTKHWTWLVEQVKTIKPLLLIIDPRSFYYGGDENDNVAVAQWYALLRTLPCAVLVSHHVSKQRQDLIDSAAGRGASSARDAARVVLRLTPLSQREIDHLHIQNPHLFTRLDTVKANFSARPADGVYLRRGVEGVLSQVDLLAEARGIDAQLLERMAKTLADLIGPNEQDLTRREIEKDNRGADLRQDLKERVGKFATRPRIGAAMERAIERGWVRIEELRNEGEGGRVRSVPRQFFPEEPPF